MKYFIFNISLIFLFLSVNSCQERKPEVNAIGMASPDSLTEKELINFISEYDRIWAERDTIKMKEIMDESYVYFSSTGRLSTKANTISMFDPANSYIIDTVARRQIKYHLNGNTAIVSSNWIGRGSFAGEKFNDNQLCGMVIQKSGEGIKIISEHCAQIVP